MSATLRGYDTWHTMRENADQLPLGLRVHRADHPTFCIAAVWLPKAMKPAGYYRFRTVEAREQYVEKFVANYAEVQAMKAHRKAKARAAVQEHINEVGVGHIFRYSWGYDQTNVEYYQVTEKRGQMVTVHEIAQSTVPGSEGFMCEHVKPRIGHFLPNEKPITKRLQFTEQGEAYLSFEFGWCGLWRGGSSYQSHYA